MSIRDVNDVSCLVRPAHVLCGSEFRSAPPELGDDLFLCDYEYNEMWQVGGRGGRGTRLLAVRQTWETFLARTRGGAEQRPP